jgi:hypothetical protein
MPEPREAEGEVGSKVLQRRLHREGDLEQQFGLRELPLRLSTNASCRSDDTRVCRWRRNPTISSEAISSSE